VPGRWARGLAAGRVGACVGYALSRWCGRCGISRYATGPQIAPPEVTLGAPRLGMHCLLQTTSVEPRRFRAATHEDIGAVPRQRDDRAILQCGAVISQRAIAGDEQIHTGVEQITRIPTGRKLENDGIALGAVRPNLLCRRRA